MRLAEAFSSSESIVALLNAVDGRFLDVNAAFERITGYGRDTVIGRIPLEVGLWRDPEFRAQLWESLRAERRIVDVPTALTRADGAGSNDFSPPIAASARFAVSCTSGSSA